MNLGIELRSNWGEPLIADQGIFWLLSCGQLEVTKNPELAKQNENGGLA